MKATHFSTSGERESGGRTGTGAACRQMSRGCQCRSRVDRGQRAGAAAWANAMALVIIQVSKHIATVAAFLSVLPSLSRSLPFLSFIPPHCHYSPAQSSLNKIA